MTEPTDDMRAWFRGKGTIEREGQEKPVCVAEMVSIYYR